MTETCHSSSTLRAAMLTERVKILLRKQGTTFGDFIITEFEDPILKEHTVSVSVSDIPNNLQVRQPLLRCLCRKLYVERAASHSRPDLPLSSSLSHLQQFSTVCVIYMNTLSEKSC